MESSIYGKWDKSGRENTMSKILITIAIPTYNNEDTIGRAIDSCLNQTDLFECEILVINNCSNDRTDEVVSKYGGKIRIVNNKNKLSMFENHNEAMRRAEGDYILFCHSDDELYSEAIVKLKKNLQKRGYPNKYICWGHSHYRDFTPSIENAGYNTSQTFCGQYAVNAFLPGGITPSGTCYSKHFLEIGGFLRHAHRLAPSDATSMILAAEFGFVFEMMPEILFRRTEASTLTSKINQKDKDAGYTVAFSDLIKQLSNERLINIIESSRRSKSIPIHFYQSISNIYPKEVFKRVVEFIIRTPTLMLNKRVFLLLVKTLATSII